MGRARSPALAPIRCGAVQRRCAGAALKGGGSVPVLSPHATGVVVWCAATEGGGRLDGGTRAGRPHRAHRNLHARGRPRARALNAERRTRRLCVARRALHSGRGLGGPRRGDRSLWRAHGGARARWILRPRQEPLWRGVHLLRGVRVCGERGGPLRGGGVTPDDPRVSGHALDDGEPRRMGAGVGKPQAAIDSAWGALPARVDEPRVRGARLGDVHTGAARRPDRGCFVLRLEGAERGADDGGRVGGVAARRPLRAHGRRGVRGGPGDAQARGAARARLCRPPQGAAGHGVLRRIAASRGGGFARAAAPRRAACIAAVAHVADGGGLLVRCQGLGGGDGGRAAGRRVQRPRLCAARAATGPQAAHRGARALAQRPGPTDGRPHRRKGGGVHLSPPRPARRGQDADSGGNRRDAAPAAVCGVDGGARHDARGARIQSDGHPRARRAVGRARPHRRGRDAAREENQVGHRPQRHGVRDAPAPGVPPRGALPHLEPRRGAGSRVSESSAVRPQVRPPLKGLTRARLAQPPRSARARRSGFGRRGARGARAQRPPDQERAAARARARAEGRRPPRAAAP
mmetsp:Transcript_12653/g.41712  ORF Transcript_12653/g.41712 Transcript_12653/m.41712 type:complete len:575 (-) Transcript_12653:277-2001(-)